MSYHPRSDSPIGQNYEENTPAQPIDKQPTGGKHRRPKFFEK